MKASGITCPRCGLVLKRAITYGEKSYGCYSGHIWIWTIRQCTGKAGSLWTLEEVEEPK